VDFDTAEQTLVYDLNTQLWHNRGTWISEENRYIAWRPRFHAYAFNEHRMLDSTIGALYRMDEDIFTDVDERPIRRIRRTPVVFDEDERIFLNSFELNAEVGIAPQPQDPLLELYQYTSSFWQLEEAAGLRVDQIGNNDLTAFNAPGNAAGIIGNAVSVVRASDQAVYIPDASQAGLNPGLDDFSISAWINPTALSASSYSIVAKGLTDVSGAFAPGYGFSVRGTGTQFPARVNAGFGSVDLMGNNPIQGLSVTFAPIIPLNTWTHIVVTFDRDGVCAGYFNGVRDTDLFPGFAANGDQMNRLGDTRGDCQPSSPFVVGGFANNGDVVPAAGTFDGLIDAVGFFRTVLNQQQVNVLYNGGAGRQMQASDIGLWQPNDGSDPRVMFRQSKDGGKTWGIERWRSAGKTGEYATRIMWDRIGSGRRRVIEVSTTDNIPWRLLGGFIKPRPGQRGSSG
jgi:hypothetical protein